MKYISNISYNSCTQLYRKLWYLYLLFACKENFWKLRIGYYRPFFVAVNVDCAIKLSWINVSVNIYACECFEYALFIELFLLHLANKEKFIFGKYLLNVGFVILWNRKWVKHFISMLWKKLEFVMNLNYTLVYGRKLCVYVYNIRIYS